MEEAYSANQGSLLEVDYLALLEDSQVDLLRQWPPVGLDYLERQFSNLPQHKVHNNQLQVSLEQSHQSQQIQPLRQAFSANLKS